MTRLDKSEALNGLPAPASWYLICRSADLPRGGVRSVEIAGRAIVLYRGESGVAHALSAHCSHLGTHLGHGTVVGDRLRCPLHHWEYGADGACRRIPAASAIPERACQSSFPVAERFGVILLFNGAEASFPPPRFNSVDEGELRSASGDIVPLKCPWNAVFANAFDVQHLEMVHGRALREEPVVERLDQHRLQFRYASRVTGDTATDRVMRALSNDHIRVVITCWAGTTMTVESDLGRVRSSLLLGVMPTVDGCEVRPVFCVRKHGAAGEARVRIARWLFYGFLRRDINILQDMIFRPNLLLPQDEALGKFNAFVREQCETFEPLRIGIRP